MLDSLKVRPRNAPLTRQFQKRSPGAGRRRGSGGSLAEGRLDERILRGSSECTAKMNDPILELEPPTQVLSGANKCPMLPRAPIE